jgi:RimJ/RimL family protein N-acetyltransferase
MNDATSALTAGGRASQSRIDGVPEHPDVVLDGLRDQDLPTLCRWFNTIEELHFWTTRRLPRPYEDVEADIRNRCRVGLFTVIRNELTGEPSGFLDGRVRELHGVAEFEVYLPRESRLRSGLVAIYRFVSHLFRSYPLRKVYCQTYAYNSRVVHLLEASGFVKDGCFKEFTWWQDRYWDMYVYSLDRSALESLERGEGRVGHLLSQLRRAP